MDDTDRRILRVLQDDSSLPVSEVANRVGLSGSACWKRINRMQEEGVIRRQVAILDPVALGYGLMVFISIETKAHSSEGINEFTDKIKEMPEILEIHRLAGDVDYLLKAVVPDMQSFDAFYKRLIDLAPLTKVTSRFAIETVKATTSLPV